MPASSDPSITVAAPAAIALTMSPEYVMPPSAITGTPSWRARRVVCQIADSCGMPAPLITRVVQIEPAPTPTLTASAPAAAQGVDALLGDDVAGDHRRRRASRP